MAVEREPRDLSDDDIPLLRDVSLDKYGKITAIQDQDGNVHVSDHLNQDHTNDFENEEEEEEEPEEKSPSVKAGGKKSTAVNANGAPALPGQETQTDSPDVDNEQYLNSAHYVLSQLSFEGTEVDLGNGVVKPIAELTPEDEVVVLLNSFEDVRDFYEHSFEDAWDFYEQELQQQENHPNRVQDADEAALVNLKRSGLTMRQIAEQILASDPISGKDNDTLARLSLKDKFPGFTEEEIDEQLAFAREKGKVDKLSDEYRAKMKDADVRALEEIQQQQIALDQQREMDEDLAHGKLVTEYLVATKELARIPINDEVKEYLAQQMLPAKPGTLSPLIQKLQTPAGLAEAAFWMTYGPTIMDARFKQGAETAKKVTDKFSDRPIVASTNQRKNKPGDKYQADLEKLGQVTHIGTVK